MKETKTATSAPSQMQGLLNAHKSSGQCVQWQSGEHKLARAGQLFWIKKTQMLKEVEISVACAQFTSPSVSFVHRYRISSNVLHPQILFALKLYPQDRQG